jgi:hypothetical protein
MQTSKNFQKLTEEEKLEIFEVNELETRLEMWGSNDIPPNPMCGFFNYTCIPNPSCGSTDAACGPEPIP